MKDGTIFTDFTGCARNTIQSLFNKGHGLLVCLLSFIIVSKGVGANRNAMGIRVQTNQTISTIGAYRKGIGMVYGFDPVAFMIDIVVRADLNLAQLNHLLPLSCKMELGGHPGAICQNVSNGYPVKGDLPFPFDIEFRFRRKTEGIQEPKENRIAKVRGRRHSRKTHVHDGKQNGIHACQQILHTNGR